MKQPSIKMHGWRGAVGVVRRGFGPGTRPSPARERLRQELVRSQLCQSCHGMNGKGGGPFVELLRRAPPDLTLEAKKNQGVFPMDRLYAVIEGANVPSHGSRDMPIWGREFRIKDAEYYIDTPYDADALVRARILSLLEYLNRIQVR